MSSVFTKIVNGEIPCYKIYEDDKTLAFLDIHPETKGHTLVIPKKEVDKLYDLPDEDYYAVMATAKKLAKHMEKVMGARTVWKVVGSDVPHAHVHLYPYDETWFQGREIPMTEDDFKEVQAKLTYED